MTALNAYSANRMPSIAAPTTPMMPATPSTPAPDAGSPASRTATGFDPLPATSGATTGGGIGDALLSGIGRITAFANNGMKAIEAAIQGDMTSGGGEVDPAKMQQYAMKMSSYETMMQLAAKMQEKQDNAIQVWLR